MTSVRKLPGMDTLAKTAAALSRSASNLFRNDPEPVPGIKPAGKLPEWKVMCQEAKELAMSGEREEALMLYHRALRMRPNAPEIKTAIRTLTNSITESVQASKTTKLFATMKMMAHKKRQRKSSLTGADRIRDLEEHERQVSGKRLGQDPLPPKPGSNTKRLPPIGNVEKDTEAEGSEPIPGVEDKPKAVVTEPGDIPTITINCDEIDEMTPIQRERTLLQLGKDEVDPNALATESKVESATTTPGPQTPEPKDNPPGSELSLNLSTLDVNSPRSARSRRRRGSHRKRKKEKALPQFTFRSLQSDDDSDGSSMGTASLAASSVDLRNKAQTPRDVAQPDDQSVKGTSTVAEPQVEGSKDQDSNDDIPRAEPAGNQTPKTKETHVQRAPTRAVTSQSTTSSNTKSTTSNVTRASSKDRLAEKEAILSRWNRAKSFYQSSRIAGIDMESLMQREKTKIKPIPKTERRPSLKRSNTSLVKFDKNNKVGALRKTTSLKAVREELLSPRPETLKRSATTLTALPPIKKSDPSKSEHIPTTVSPVKEVSGTKATPSLQMNAPLHQNKKEKPHGQLVENMPVEKSSEQPDVAVEKLETQHGESAEILSKQPVPVGKPSEKPSDTLAIEEPLRKAFVVEMPPEKSALGQTHAEKTASALKPSEKLALEQEPFEELTSAQELSEKPASVQKPTAYLDSSPKPPEKPTLEQRPPEKLDSTPPEPPKPHKMPPSVAKSPEKLDSALMTPEKPPSAQIAPEYAEKSASGQKQACKSALALKSPEKIASNPKLLGKPPSAQNPPGKPTSTRKTDASAQKPVEKPMLAQKTDTSAQRPAEEPTLAQKTDASAQRPVEKPTLAQKTDASAQRPVEKPVSARRPNIKPALVVRPYTKPTSASRLPTKALSPMKPSREPQHTENSSEHTITNTIKKPVSAVRKPERPLSPKKPEHPSEQPKQIKSTEQSVKRAAKPKQSTFSPRPIVRSNTSTKLLTANPGPQGVSRSTSSLNLSKSKTESDKQNDPVRNAVLRAKKDTRNERNPTIGKASVGARAVTQRKVTAAPRGGQAKVELQKKLEEEKGMPLEEMPEEDRIRFQKACAKAMILAKSNVTLSVKAKEQPRPDSRTADWQQEAPEFLLQSTQRLEQEGVNSSPKEYALAELKRIQLDFDEERYEKARYRSKVVVERTQDAPVTDDFTETDKQNVLANLWSMQGNACLELGLVEEALDAHLKDLNIATENGLLDSKSRALANVGRVHARAGRFRDAIDVFADKVALCVSATERAWLFHEMGRCFYQLGEYADAQEFADKSAVNAQETKDSHMQFQASFLLAQCYEKLQAFDESLIEYKKSLDLAVISDNEEQISPIEEAMQRVNALLAGQIAHRRATKAKVRDEDESMPVTARGINIDGAGGKSSPTSDLYYLTLLYVMATLPEY